MYVPHGGTWTTYFLNYPRKVKNWVLYHTSSLKTNDVEEGERQQNSKHGDSLKYMLVYHTRLKLCIEKLDCKRRQYITIRNSSFHKLKHWWKPVAPVLRLCFVATLRFIQEAVQGFRLFLSDWINYYVMRWFCKNSTFIFITCTAETIYLHWLIWSVYRTSLLLGKKIF